MREAAVFMGAEMFRALEDDEGVFSLFREDSRTGALELVLGPVPKAPARPRLSPWDRQLPLFDNFQMLTARPNWERFCGWVNAHPANRVKID